MGGVLLLRDGASCPLLEGICSQISRKGPGPPCPRISHRPNRDLQQLGGAATAGGGTDAAPLRSTCSASSNYDATPFGTPRRNRCLNPSLARNRFWRLASEGSGSDSDEVGADSGVDCKFFFHIKLLVIILKLNRMSLILTAALGE